MDLVLVAAVALVPRHLSRRLKKVASAGWCFRAGDCGDFVLVVIALVARHLSRRLKKVAFAVIDGSPQKQSAINKYREPSRAGEIRTLSISLSELSLCSNKQGKVR